MSFDVVGIGNAIVDVLAHAEDAFLESKGMSKGAMTLIDGEMAENLYKDMGPAVECSGGSAANTIAALASLGGSAAYVGKVKNDQLGAIFRHDIRALGVHFETELAHNTAPTARCLIFVSPDAQRTMQTFLGACIELGPDDIDPDVIEKAKVTYLEGYLWDPEQAKQAFIKAADIAHKAGQKVSLSLSDPFCVDRHREEFLDLINGHIDILFANEEEIMSLYEVDDFEEALNRVKGHCEIAALTRGPEGSVVVTGDTIHRIPAEQLDRVVDTTGAGDAYAAGFLYGYTQGKSLDESARIGGICAAEIIGHMGARPDVSLADVVAKATAA